MAFVTLCVHKIPSSLKFKRKNLKLKPKTHTYIRSAYHKLYHVTIQWSPDFWGGYILKVPSCHGYHTQSRINENIEYSPEKDFKGILMH